MSKAAFLIAAKTWLREGHLGAYCDDLDGKILDEDAARVAELLETTARLARAEEREACARLADDEAVAWCEQASYGSPGNYDRWSGAEDCARELANKIRARGQS